MHARNLQPMKVAAERYRGIEYVRISALPDDERKMFWQTFDQQKVFKIPKADALLNDCVLLNDFLHWQETRPALPKISFISPEEPASHAA